MRKRRKSNKNKKKKLRNYILLIFVSLLVFDLIWYHGLTITIANYTGEKPSIEPGHLYFYVKIRREYIIRNITINNRPAIANIRIIMKDISSNQNILNISLVNIECTEGFQFKNVEKKVILRNISTDKLYYVYLYDNITKALVPVGLPVKYNASVYTTISGGSFYKLDISYGLISKDIVIKNLGDNWEVRIRIITLDMKNKTYIITPNEYKFTNTIVTPIYIKIWYLLLVRKYILLFELHNNSITFNTRDNLSLLALINVVIMIIILIIYLRSKKILRSIIFRTR